MVHSKLGIFKSYYSTSATNFGSVPQLTTGNHCIAIYQNNEYIFQFFIVQFSSLKTCQQFFFYSIIRRHVDVARRQTEKKTREKNPIIMMTTSPATFQNNVGFYLIRRSISSGFRKRIESLQMLLYTSPYISAVTTEKEEKKKKKKKKKTTTEYSTHVIHAEKNIYIYLYRVHISRRPWPRSLRMSFSLYTFASGELLV